MPVLPVEMAGRWGREDRQELATIPAGALSIPLRTGAESEKKPQTIYADHCGQKQAIPLDSRGKMA